MILYYIYILMSILCKDNCIGICQNSQWNCKFLHNNCKFGIECNKLDCKFGHPINPENRIKINNIIRCNIIYYNKEYLCPYGILCINYNCTNNHKISIEKRILIKNIVNTYKLSFNIKNNNNDLKLNQIILEKDIELKKLKEELEYVKNQLNSVKKITFLNDIETQTDYNQLYEPLNYLDNNISILYKNKLIRKLNNDLLLFKNIIQIQILKSDIIYNYFDISFNDKIYLIEYNNYNKIQIIPYHEDKINLYFDQKICFNSLEHLILFFKKK